MSIELVSPTLPTPVEAGIAVPLVSSAYQPTDSHSEIAITAVPLGNGALCAGQTLLLGFAANTGMATAYRSVTGPVTLHEFAEVGAIVLRELHVPQNVEVDVICRYFPAVDVVDQLKAITGRTHVLPNDGLGQRLSFDEIGREIGRQVRSAAKYEEVLRGYEPESDAERQLFVEAVTEPILYWYHRRPWPGAKSPIQRHVEAAAAANSA